MEGHIRKPGKDSWAVVVSLGRDPTTGKRRQLWRSVRGTKRQAQGLLVKLLHYRDTGIDAPPGRVTVAEYLQHWLSVRVHITPTLSGIPLAKLRALHVQQAHTRVREKGLSARTALHCHRVLREALQHQERQASAACASMIFATPTPLYCFSRTCSLKLSPSGWATQG